MTYVIAEPCIGVKDTACVEACPVDCIYPKKSTTYDDGRPSFEDASQLTLNILAMQFRGGFGSMARSLKWFQTRFLKLVGLQFT
jgi:NAD-dependent dihydropyrimidine dehydrogenase PreA subunit